MGRYSILICKRRVNEMVFIPIFIIIDGMILRAAKILSMVFLCLAVSHLFYATQQTASTVEPPRTVDKDFHFPNPDPAYPAGQGPVVVVDEAHNNFHTSVTTYIPFARLLTTDGYVVRRGLDKMTGPPSEDVRIYVIADAQPPNTKAEPPTFLPQEIRVFEDWVRNGGSLFIITDHMPDPGAVAELAAAFGIQVNNGYAFPGPPPGPSEPLVFHKKNGTLANHPLTSAGSYGDAVERIATFAGSAFRASPEFEPLLIFEKGVRTWMPTEYWTFPSGTPFEDASGWFQGGVREFGHGRIAFFSEAAMFTAQVFSNGQVKAGMNHPLGADNARLLLNVMHWLSEKD